MPNPRNQADPAPASDAPALTPRQLEVLEVLAKGLTNREIGEVLGISAGTVRVHVAAVFEALGVSNRTEATHEFHQLGLGSAGETFEARPPGARPALAVLPLTTFSDDPEARHLADGISEDLITRLARWRWFPVIARNSTFVYKDQAIDVSEISRALGARYVVEGSVRPSGDRVRITVQLIDGESGQHIWAQHYDRQFGHRFEVQDEIVDTIVATLEPSLLQAGGLRIVEGLSESLDAWDRVQEAFVFMAQNDGPGLERAAALAEEAIQLDPRLGPAYGAAFYSNFLLHLLNRSPGELAPAEKLEIDSLALERCDPAEPLAPTGRALACLARGEAEAAIGHLDRAVELAPKMVYPVWTRALALSSAGRAEESVEAHRALLRLAPEDPLLPIIQVTYGIALVMSGQVEEAIREFETSMEKAPRMVFAQTMLGVTLAVAGNEERAISLFATLREIEPRYDPLIPSAIMLPDWAHANATDFLTRLGWSSEGGVSHPSAAD